MVEVQSLSASVDSVHSCAPQLSAMLSTVHTASVVDPKLFFSDPDPTLTLISDPDPACL